jgi:hypothetical protein
MRQVQFIPVIAERSKGRVNNDDDNNTLMGRKIIAYEK